MISIKDYAKENGITYEAVRQSVKRYAPELEGHISKVSKTQYLDEYAVEFLNEKRKVNPVVMIQQDKDDEIESLKIENKNLLIRLNESQSKVTDLQANIISMQQERLAIGSPETLKIELDTKKEQLDELKRQLEEERQRRLEAEREASSYTKTIFGFFKKSK